MKTKVKNTFESIDISNYKNINSFDVLISIITGKYDIIGFNNHIGIQKAQVREDEIENALIEINNELA